MLKMYSCWHDPAEGLSAVHFQPGFELYDNEKGNGLSLKYIVYAETWDEALVIHHMREGWSFDFLSRMKKDLCTRCNGFLYSSGECYCDVP